MVIRASWMRGPDYYIKKEQQKMSDELETQVEPSEKPKRRGRPPKAAAKEDLADYHPKIDLARKLDKEKKDRVEQNKTVDVWLEEHQNTVSICRRTANGNVHRRPHYRKDRNPEQYKSDRKNKVWK